MMARKQGCEGEAIAPANAEHDRRKELARTPTASGEVHSSDKPLCRTGLGSRCNPPVAPAQLVLRMVPNSRTRMMAPTAVHAIRVAGCDLSHQKVPKLSIAHVVATQSRVSKARWR